jgi:hypothetical protein
VEFVYNHARDEEKSYGFIAQEIKEVVDDLDLAKAGLVQNMDENHLGIRTAELIPILTKAIQEQQQRIEQLESWLEKLKCNHKNRKSKKHSCEK